MNTTSTAIFNSNEEISALKEIVSSNQFYLQLTWTIIGVVIALVGLIGFFWLKRYIKERVDDAIEEYVKKEIKEQKEYLNERLKLYSQKTDMDYKLVKEDIENNKKVIDEILAAMARESPEEKQIKALEDVNKTLVREVAQLRGDVDYISVMSDIDLESEKTNKRVKKLLDLLDIAKGSSPEFECPHCHYTGKYPSGNKCPNCGQFIDD